LVLRLGLAVALVLAAFASLASAQPAPVNDRAVVTVVDTAPVVTPTIAHVDTQSVESPFVGTFDIAGAIKGTLTVLAEGRRAHAPGASRTGSRTSPRAT